MKEIQEFQPKIVAIPLASINSKYYDLSVEVGSMVLIGQKLAERYGNDKTPIFSSISGKVLKIESLFTANGIEIDHIFIENDYNKTKIQFQPLKQVFTPATIRQQLLRLGVRGIEQSSLYTKFDFDNPIQNIIVNTIYENKSFVNVDINSLYDSIELVEGLNLLQIAFNAPVSVICDDVTVAKFYKSKGFNAITVKVKPNKAWIYNGLKQILNEVPYDLLESGSIFTSLASVHATYNAVHKGSPVLSKFLVVLDSEPQIYNVKIGTLVKDILRENVTSNVYINSILNGTSMLDTNFSINEHISTLGIFSQEDEEQVCNKCGLCNDICPIKILPQNIMDAEIRMIEDRMYKYDINTCIECGLCAYVCPSKINVLEWMRRAKRRVSRG